MTQNTKLQPTTGSYHNPLVGYYSLVRMATRKNPRLRRKYDPWMVPESAVVTKGLVAKAKVAIGYLAEKLKSVSMINNYTEMRQANENSTG